MKIEILVKNIKGWEKMGLKKGDYKYFMCVIGLFIGTLIGYIILATGPAGIVYNWKAILIIVFFWISLFVAICVILINSE